MAIFSQKSIKISLFVFSCMKLQPIEVLSSMVVVHLPVHACVWGQLPALDWTRGV